MKCKVFIQDFNTICSLGKSEKEILRNLQSKSIKNDTFNINEETKTPVYSSPFTPNQHQIADRFNSRNNQLALSAITPLLTQIETLKTKFPSNRIGLVVGTSTSGIGEVFNHLRKNNNQIDQSYNYSLQVMSNLSDFLCNYLNISGISYTISTACSSSARAFIEGSQLIENDICDAVIIGGCDTLNELTIHGFNSLEALSYTQSNPFSSNRSGINIGEGASFFILSKEENQLCILGYGESSDGHHVSAPCPEGSGATIAIQNALTLAKLNSDAIDYINLHGTGTIKNDQMESLITNQIFGQKTYCSSTKPFTGHTLGAAGAIEASILCTMLKSNEVFYPPHVFDGNYDQSLPLINLNFPPTHQAKICMSNTYAFGGNNVSLILGRSS